MKKILKYLKDIGLFKFVSDEKILKKKYLEVFGQELDLDNPQTFNEKLQWLKLHDRKDIYTTMVDKYEVKEYVKNIIGEEYIIPTLGVWDKFSAIDFAKLPEQFVLKCTHDSGGLCIIKDKKCMSYEKIHEKINKSLKRNYYYFGREWPYKNVKPRIIAEEYMGSNLNDYKIFCFNGIPKIVLVCTDRYSKAGLCEDFYDIKWNHLNIKRKTHPNASRKIEKPKKLSKMLELAEKLSRDTKFLRVDFYDIDDKIYFGELTFYPASGFSGFVPDEWDQQLGDMLELK